MNVALDDDTKSHDSPNANQGNSAVPSLAPPKKSASNAISTALFVSSCMSLFPILMVVWNYDDAPEILVASSQSPSNSSSVTFSSGFLSSQGPGVDWVRRGVSWAVAVQNLEALRILLGCGYWRAGTLVVAGGMVRWVVKHVILKAAGLGEGG